MFVLQKKLFTFKHRHRDSRKRTNFVKHFGNIFANLCQTSAKNLTKCFDKICQYVVQVSLGQCVLLLQGVAEVEGLAHDTENTYGIEQNGVETRERSRSDEWTTRPRLSKLDSTTNLQEAVLIYLSQRESVAV